MTDTKDILDLRLENPFTMLVSGTTAFGKTTFTRELLIRLILLNSKLTHKVFYFYKVYQPIFDQMKKLGIVDEFIEDMCTMKFLEKNIEKNDNNCSTVVIDDQALEADEDECKSNPLSYETIPAF